MKIKKKPHTVFLPDLLVFKLQQEILKSMISALVGALQNWYGHKFFKPGKSKF